MFRASFLTWAALLAAALMLFAGASARASVGVVNDGADGAPAVIRLQSAIRRGDLAQLQNALAQIDRAAAEKIHRLPLIKIELDSPGGDVVEAVGIGRVIYQNYLMTMVRRGRECVSACVFILIAGAVHYPENGASIGVHRPLLVSWSHMSAAQAHAKYDGLMEYLRQYFAELGVADQAYDIMMRTGSADMRYFSPAELDQLRLRGEEPAWKALYAQRTAALSEPARVALAAPPALPEIDQSLRDLIIMPGADDPPQEAAAAQAEPPPPHWSRGPRFVWDSLDDGQQTPFTWSAPDVIGWLKHLAAALAEILEPLWWFLALLAFEILRGRPPVNPWDKRRRPDAWRLTPFR
jgi:hypothetical protein